MTFQYAQVTLTAGVFHVSMTQNVLLPAAATTIAVVMRVAIVASVEVQLTADAAAHAEPPQHDGFAVPAARF